MLRRLLSGFLVASCLLPQGFTALAQVNVGTPTNPPGFNPDMILTDDDVFSVRGMSQQRLVAFVESKGALGQLSLPDIDGIEKPVTDIIWRVANSYKVSPQFLLALLQKEQSLVEDPSPSARQLDWATGFGVCDDCSKDDPRIQDFKGFANQLEYAAKQMRERNLLRLLSTGKTLGGYALGKTVLIDGVSVTPANFATASLYSYTPHIHGNENLWRIWQRWFARNFPDGTVVRGTPSGKIWWIRQGAKRPFASTGVAGTLIDPAKIVDVSDTDLAAYEEGSPINFPNYALLRDPNGRIWLLVNRERRHILNMEAFRKFSFNIDEVENATDEDLAGYDIAEPITPSTTYPQGSLIQEVKTKNVWYAENGRRFAVTEPAILSLYFKNRKPKAVQPSVIGSLEDAGVYRLHDGELVKSTSGTAVYVMEYGRKRPITSGEVFETLGWKWKNVVSLPEKFLLEYDEGDPVRLDTPPTALALN